jgi:hypothetical protein
VTNPINVDEIAKRPSRYWYQDGLVEIFVGLMMVVPACLFRLAQKLPKGSLLLMLAPLAWLAVILALKRGLTTLKERLVSPRGGYIVLADASKAARISTAALFILLAIAFTILIPWEGTWGGIPGLALAVVFSGCFLASWVQARLPHLLALAAIPLLTEIWIYRNGLGSKETMFWLMVIQGAALVISGALRLRSFLKNNPRTSFGA